MNKQILKDTIVQLFAVNKGLLAMDESTGTSCFTQFLKLCSESIDFTGLGFENGCPAGIFGYVFAKKEK